MKKLRLNVPLLHKADARIPTEVIVEKAVTLPHHIFKEMCRHPLHDSSFIAEQIPRMWTDDQAHCVLYLDVHSGDGLLVESEGYSYARKSQYIPHAAELLRGLDMTEAEWQIHDAVQACAALIAEN